VTLSPAGPLSVVYEDERLIAVDKPCGQPVIAPRPVGGSTDVLPLVRQVQERLGAKAYVVHRLDRETSGLVVFAKDAKTHRRLCGLFESRAVRKLYMALVQGDLRGTGEIDKPIREFGSGRMGVDPAGKPSKTLYRVRESLQKAALVELEPHTGRRHQLRVHLYSIGHPVMGDDLYGRERPVGGMARLMLHSMSLSFEGPSGELKLTAPVPPEFTAIVAGFRKSPAAPPRKS
jgi:RluA family pseudouridine synthase